MRSAEYFDDETGSGLTDADVRDTARRQLIASAAAAVIILVGAGVMAFMPASRDKGEVAARGFVVVQQPTFVAAPGSRYASVHRGELELP